MTRFDLARRGTALVAGTLLLLALAGQVFAYEGPLKNNELRSYADVADLAMPSVVNISAEKVVEQNFQHPFLQDPFFRRFFDMPDDDNHRGTERVNRSLGSGVIISRDGYIITNNHVVENAEEIRVVFHEEQEYSAEIVGTDPQTDIALIKIEGEDFPTISMGDSDDLRIGDQVMAIGNPFGVGQTVTLGIVSALGRSIGLIDYEDLIQTDASINPGNSGGALVNMYGELVGMNTAILSRSGGSQGIGFAIPTTMIRRITEDLKESGEVERAYLGVLPQEVTQAMADYHKMDRPRGVIIAQVNEDTPAERAGLKEGDVILSVDGEEIENPSTLRNVISLSGVGHEARLAVLRDGKEKIFEVKLERFPEAEQRAGRNNAPAEDEDLIDGVTVSEISDRLRARLDLPDDVDGLIVAQLQPSSNAARAGLAEGDIIQEIGEMSVTSISDLRTALGKDEDRPIWMKVYKPAARRSLFMAVER